MTTETFRFDLRSLSEPTIILIDTLEGKRSELPVYSYVVLPSTRARSFVTLAK